MFAKKYSDFVDQPYKHLWSNPWPPVTLEKLWLGSGYAVKLILHLENWQFVQVLSVEIRPPRNVHLFLQLKQWSHIQRQCQGSKGQSCWGNQRNELLKNFSQTVHGQIIKKSKKLAINQWGSHTSPNTLSSYKNWIYHSHSLLNFSFFKIKKGERSCCSCR